MTTAPTRQCASCGREIAKAHARHGDDDYCGSCYAREFSAVACGTCGRPVRTLGGQGPAMCKSCRVKDRVCMRCGKPTPRASFTNAKGVACAPCTKFFKPPQLCPVCGTLSRYLARDLKAGFTEPTCQSCRSRKFITCPCCRKYRAPAGADRAGRLVCARCLAAQGQSFICPQCHQPKPRDGACDRCYWRARARQLVADGRASLSHGWARDALVGFTEAWFEQVSDHSAGIHVRPHIETFKLLDSLIANPRWVTAEG